MFDKSLGAAARSGLFRDESHRWNRRLP